MIETSGLSKTFSRGKSTTTAVHPTDLTVATGEMVALLGPNGAGKSTTFRMLATLLRPTAGSASVCGFDTVRHPGAVRARIGYVGQGTSGGHSHRARDEMMSQGAFYGLSKADTKKRTTMLLDSLDIAAHADKTVSKLSGGQKRRLDIALGLLHAPRLLFLDEPSTGLDPQSRANLWEHIRRLREEHDTTIFVTTHYLEEADQYAERVLVMDGGRIIADDTADQLKADLAGDRVLLGFADAGQAARAAAVAGRVADASATPDGAVLELRARAGDALLPRLVRELDSEEVPPLTASSTSPTLDDVFLALTGRSLREENNTGPAQPENDSADQKGAAKGDPNGNTDKTDEVMA
ncbi:ABC transporter [Herbiconiux sp. L3-i23]|nr:ABC transporter [Herbiconiux sp. L3-i23]